MSKRERFGWTAVLLIPQFVARWLVRTKLGNKLPIPRYWAPYIFGRSLGIDGSKCLGAPARERVTLTMPAIEV